MSCFISIKNSN